MAYDFLITESWGNLLQLLIKLFFEVYWHTIVESYWVVHHHVLPVALYSSHSRQLKLFSFWRHLFSVTAYSASDKLVLLKFDFVAGRTIIFFRRHILYVLVS
jgi:hypothetical protein